ncbi:MAG: hypothetical protein IT442_04910 [Phycisphaeraceae bacterium]|nr:hypothetical protein [Phycisphaeraceae bacterium]
MARRTFADYKLEVRHALGSPAEAEMDIAPATIVNDALEHLAALHAWNWLISGEKYLDLTASQPYVELPDDFGDLISLAAGSSWNASLAPVTWDEMIALRRGSLATGAWSSYVYCVSTGNVETGDEDAGLTLPTLELYPTPTETVVDALSFIYRRVPRRLVDDTDRPQIPSYLDRALSLLARGFARTDYEDDPESAYTRELRSILADAMNRDGLTRTSFGLGASGLVRGRRSNPFEPVSVPDRT